MNPSQEFFCYHHTTRLSICLVSLQDCFDSKNLQSTLLCVEAVGAIIALKDHSVYRSNTSCPDILQAVAKLVTSKHVSVKAAALDVLEEVYRVEEDGKYVL